MQVYCLEIEPYMLELAKPKFEAAGVADQIEVLVGSATDSIEKLVKRAVCFDIAFLDADKTGYLGYYKQLMDNQLINPGGIIVVDNALMKVCWPAYPLCVNATCIELLLTGRLSTTCVQAVAVKIHVLLKQLLSISVFIINILFGCANLIVCKQWLQN